MNLPGFLRCLWWLFTIFCLQQENKQHIAMYLHKKPKIFLSSTCTHSHLICIYVTMAWRHGKWNLLLLLLSKKDIRFKIMVQLPLKIYIIYICVYNVCTYFVYFFVMLLWEFFPNSQKDSLFKAKFKSKYS